MTLDAGLYQQLHVLGRESWTLERKVHHAVPQLQHMDPLAEDSSKPYVLTNRNCKTCEVLNTVARISCTTISKKSTWKSLIGKLSIKNDYKP